MISFAVPPGMYSNLAYDGTATFSGVVQSFFTVIDPTGQNIGISRKWNDKTAAQYARDYLNRILPVISQLFGGEKPMHEFSSDDFEQILSELKKKHHYGEERANHYRYLLRVAYYAGVNNCLYPDQLFWEEIYDALDPEQYEKHRAVAMTRTRKSFSIQEDIHLLLYFVSLDPTTASGEDIGLALMYFLGLRNNEACGTDYSAFRLLHTHPDRAVYDMVQTTVIGSNQLKSGGKTSNAPRTLPLHSWLYEFLQSRKTWIENQIATGLFVLPDGIQSIEKLPVVCKGLDFAVRAHTTDLSRAGRTLFETVGIQKSELAVLQQILFSEDFRSTQIEEKDPTTYLLRRNVATRLYCLGFEWTTIQYWIAHEIEDSLLQRNFFADEETLYEIGAAYERHPIFALLHAEVNHCATETPDHKNRIHFSNTSDSDTLYLIRAKSLEPGSTISLSIQGSSSFQISQTDIPSQDPCGNTVDIDSALYRAYWKAYTSKHTP